MDVQPKIDELIEIIENARSMPMSASCVVNRADIVARLQEIRGMLPGELAEAARILGDREAVIAEGRREAERVIAGAREERGSLVADTAVAREAYTESERIVAEARREAERIREEADDYVDRKLANFEVVLTKTLGAIGRGREKMRGRRPIDELGDYLQAQDNAGTRGPSLQEQLDGDQDGFPGAPEPVPAAPAAPPATGGYPSAVPPQPQGQPGYYGQPAPAYGPGGYDQGAYEQSYDQAHAAQTGHTGYDQQVYGAQPGAAVPAQGGYDQGGYPARQADQYGAGTGLDETSFFDTSLIDVRRFQQDR